MKLRTTRQSIEVLQFEIMVDIKISTQASIYVYFYTVFQVKRFNAINIY